MYQTLHTLHQTKKQKLSQAENGVLLLQTQADLVPWGRASGLCFKLSQELHIAVEVINQNLVIIEDSTKGMLVFLAEPYIVTTFNGSQLFTDMRILYEAYSALRRCGQSKFDFSVHNLYRVKGQLRLLDLGIEATEIGDHVFNLGMLMLHAYLPKLEWRPLKYMTSEQNGEYLSRVLSQMTTTESRILSSMVGPESKRPQWDELGMMLVDSNMRTLSNYRGSAKSCNQYSYALQRIQSNIRSKSGRQLRSTTVHNSRDTHQTMQVARNESNSFSYDAPNKIAQTIIRVDCPMKRQMKYEGRRAPSPFQEGNQIPNPTDGQQILIPPTKPQIVISDTDIESNGHSEQPTVFEFKRSAARSYIPSQAFVEDIEIQTIVLQEEWNQHYTDYAKKYKKCFQDVNLVGKTIVKCIEYLDAYNNLWIMPLFIIFKRMFQIRRQVQMDISKAINPWKLKYFQEFLQSQLGTQLIDDIQQENLIVESEVQIILTKSLLKVDKLDKHSRIKIEPLLSMDLSVCLREIAFVYLYSQILPRISHLHQEASGSTNKQNVQELLTKIYCSLIILETAPYAIDLDYQDYKQNKSQLDYQTQLVNRVTQLKQRIITKGYKLA